MEENRNTREGIGIGEEPLECHDGENAGAKGERKKWVRCWKLSMGSR